MDEDRELGTLRALAVCYAHSMTDPNAIADRLGALVVPVDVAADLVLYACASDRLYLRMYADVAEALGLIFARRGASLGEALVRVGLCRTDHPRRHTHALLADLARRGVVPSQSLPDPLPPPLARRLA